MSLKEAYKLLVIGAEIPTSENCIRNGATCSRPSPTVYGVGRRTAFQPSWKIKKAALIAEEVKMLLTKLNSKFAFLEATRR